MVPEGIRKAEKASLLALGVGASLLAWLFYAAVYWLVTWLFLRDYGIQSFWAFFATAVSLLGFYLEHRRRWLVGVESELDPGSVPPADGGGALAKTAGERGLDFNPIGPKSVVIFSTVFLVPARLGPSLIYSALGRPVGLGE